MASVAPGYGGAAMSFMRRRRHAPARAGTPVRAEWNGAVIAESADTVVVEGNHYFPPEHVRSEHLRASDRHTTCPWKGVASYYDVVVGDEVNRAAAWYYPEPKPAAEEVRGRIAFWQGVRVRPAQDEPASSRS